MVRLEKFLLALLRIVLVLFAATLSRTASADTVQAKPATGSSDTGLNAAETAQGSPSGEKDDGADDDDDDDDGEEQQ